ncbi:hypothetical protein [Clostridium sp. VAP23]|uniref:hypothetical protein n=1 Tax=Clostridium sp. VAP23 TaxID=2949981 RepID=UPI00207A96D9|nr:hypothetical protein [Clostridium sp. VAP23]
MKKVISKVIYLGLGVVTLLGVSIQKVSATQIMLPSFRNVVAGADSNVTNNKGWVQKINTNGNIVWSYYDDDGKKHIGWLNENEKYYYFDIDGNLTMTAN